MAKRDRKQPPVQRRRRENDPAFFQLAYNFAAHSAHALLDDNARRQARVAVPDLDERARRRIDELERLIEAALNEQEDERLREFLVRMVRPCTFLLDVGLRIAFRHLTDAEAKAILAARAGEQVEPDELTAPVRRAFEGDPAPRARYNAACLFAMVGERAQAEHLVEEALTMALDELRTSLVEAPGAEARGRAMWAAKDPSLRALRRHPRWRPDVDLLLDAFTLPPPEEPARDADLA